MLLDEDGPSWSKTGGMTSADASAVAKTVGEAQHSAFSEQCLLVKPGSRGPIFLHVSRALRFDHSPLVFVSLRTSETANMKRLL